MAICSGKTKRWMGAGISTIANSPRYRRNWAKAYRDKWTSEVNSYDDFKKAIEGGGFLLAHWDGTPATEKRVKDETKATIRCIPFDGEEEDGRCILTGEPSRRRGAWSPHA